jgi:hypothetical protein
MIPLFILKLTAGITLMWLLMPRREVTDGFFRIQMRLLLGLTVLAYLLLSRSTTWHEAVGQTLALQTASQLKQLQLVAAIVAYPGSIFWALGRRGPGNVCIWLLSGLCGVSLMLHSCRVPGRSGLVLQLLSDFSSSAVCGAILTGMLLGHWYLTTPTMSIRPLYWCNRALLTAAVIRLIVSAILLFQRGGFAWSEDGGNPVHWMWYGMRLCGGIAAPIAVVILVSRILKYRNTQSATGVLFAGLILVFMGEMTAIILEHSTQRPC